MVVFSSYFKNYRQTHAAPFCLGLTRNCTQRRICIRICHIVHAVPFYFKTYHEVHEEHEGSRRLQCQEEMRVTPRAHTKAVACVSDRLTSGLTTIYTQCRFTSKLATKGHEESRRVTKAK